MVPSPAAVVSLTTHARATPAVQIEANTWLREELRLPASAPSGLMLDSLDLTLGAPALLEALGVAEAGHAAVVDAGIRHRRLLAHRSTTDSAITTAGTKLLVSGELRPRVMSLPSDTHLQVRDCPAAAGNLHSHQVTPSAAVPLQCYNCVAFKLSTSIVPPSLREFLFACHFKIARALLIRRAFAFFRRRASRWSCCGSDHTHNLGAFY